MYLKLSIAGTDVKQKKGGVGLCNAEKDLPKVNSTVVFLMHCEPAEWSLNSYKFRVYNNFFCF